MKLITEDIWTQISRAAKNSGRSYVAVAYLGKGAFDQLPLASASILVVDASESSVMSGSTNPFELLRYLEAGIKVFNHNRLHAKVYVFDRQAWVGSANASENSRSNLLECMAFSNERSSVADAIRFVKSLALDPVTPNYANYLTTIYKPPRTGKNPENSLWIQRLHDYEYSVAEQEVHDKNKLKLKTELQSGNYFVDSVRYKPADTFAKNVVIGDTLIRIQDKWVYAPVKILGKEKSYTDDSVLIFFEDHEGARKRRVSNFEAELKTVGIFLKSRKYPGSQNFEKIIKIWGK